MLAKTMVFTIYGKAIYEGYEKSGRQHTSWP
jgi:hypothetical protein